MEYLKRDVKALRATTIQTAKYWLHSNVANYQDKVLTTNENSTGRGRLFSIDEEYHLPSNRHLLPAVANTRGRGWVEENFPTSVGVMKAMQ
ncbi:unnamed protein product [Dovyalis caffra]|uniref:Uncharacterized protein n=1 Tax=Dovyalis caffra TaxID=77055 RepID=A0AAV1SAR1_9ROSI|nr:unnamed protein product [Dovyalis caffra]